MRQKPLWACHLACLDATAELFTAFLPWNQPVECAAIFHSLLAETPHGRVGGLPAGASEAASVAACLRSPKQAFFFTSVITYPANYSETNRGMEVRAIGIRTT